MTKAEIEEDLEDIEDIVRDIGEEDRTANTTYLRLKISNYDKTYLEDVSKAFDPFLIPSVDYGDVTASELTELGLDFKKMRKIFIAQKSLDGHGIESPREQDRIRHRGIIYDILRFKEHPLHGRNYGYVLMLKEAIFTAQDEERREEIDPQFEPDALQAEDDTDTTKVRTDEFEDVPAKVIGTIIELYDIVAGFNDQFSMDIDNLGAQTITLVEADDQTAADIAADMQTKFDTAFGSVVVNITADSGLIIIKTLSVGETNAEIEILDVANDAYMDLGFKSGVTKGNRLPIQFDDGDYDDEGNPK